jgi:endonuclease-3
MMADRKARAAAILRGLRKLYPDAHCELAHKTPLELLVATILSAQCTDKRVNLVTKTLFRKYRTARDYAKAKTAELEGLIRSTGFFRSKARSIQETATVLAAEHGGKVPRTMEELLQLRGVARKTANVILGTAFGRATGIVVDTHMKRLAWRMDLTDESDPEKVERDLMAVVPKKDWIAFSHGMVWHGRRVCFARSPDCPGCALNKVCPKRGV